MKTIFLTLALCLAAVCNSTNTAQKDPFKATIPNNTAEVLIFVAEQATDASLMMSQITDQVIKQYFTKDIDAGYLTVRTIKISDAKYAEFVKTHNITQASMFLLHNNEGMQRTYNLTLNDLKFKKGNEEILRKKIANTIYNRIKSYRPPVVCTHSCCGTKINDSEKQRMRALHSKNHDHDHNH